MSVKLPPDARGRMVELISKAGREEKNSDVLMWVGTKTDKASGQMSAQVRGVGTTSIFQKVRNAFLGRQAASAENIRNLFMQRGMTPAQADTALDKVTMVGKHYSAKSVEETIKNFEKDNFEAPVQGKILSDPKVMNMSKCSIELELMRVRDDELPEYNPNKS